MTTWSDLSRSARWSPVVELVRRWTIHPLSSTDGLTADAVDEIEADACVSLPQALREWFLLLGARIASFRQDEGPRIPLRVNEGRIHIWDENQFVWSLVVDDRVDTDDPSVVFLEPSQSTEFACPTGSLAQVLHAHLVSELFFADASSAIGATCASFRSQKMWMSDDAFLQLAEGYDESAVAPHPTCGVPMLEGDGVFWRHCGWVELITCTDAAWHTAQLKLRNLSVDVEFEHSNQG